MAVLLPWELRARVLDRVLAGGSVKGAARECGVNVSTALKWVKLAGMTDFSASRHGGGLVVLEPIEHTGKGKYRRVSGDDRMFIQGARSGDDPMPVSKIAELLGLSRSTVYRELQRGQVEHGLGRHVSGKDSFYHAGVADRRAAQLRHKPKCKKLDNPVLRGVVVEWLNEGWSPDAVAGRLRREFPDNPEMHVSHETIYQALYVQGKGALRHELMVEKALRSGRAARKPQSQLPPRSGRPWVEGARLSDRPPEASDRAVPGHWEGDLVVGPNNSGVVTLVERASRFALIGRLPGCRDSKTVIDVMVEMIRTLPRELFTTVTWDQGVEMAQHVDFTVATGCEVFFCDPHSPWQRGSNEQFNGLLREFFPKGTDFNTVSDEELARAARLLNTRPRKTLDYWKPSERLREAIGVALAT